MVRALVFVLLIATPVGAETNPLRWRGHEQTAGAITDWLVAAQLGAETATRYGSDHRWHALGCEAIRFGVAFGASELTKRLVHRTRPDASDAKSFYSAHTQAAALASGWNRPIGLSIAVAVALGRMGANRHYGTDVSVGFAAGELARRVCE